MAKHYTMSGIGFRFETRALAERFRELWPGVLGDPTPVEATIYYAPAWRIGTRTDGTLYSLTVENYTHYFNF